MHVQCSSKPFSTDRKQPPEHSQNPPRSDSYFDWNVLCVMVKRLPEVGFLYFRRSATFSMAAFAHASSPPLLGTPLTPTAPMTSLPIRIGTPPLRMMTSEMSF